MLASRINAVSLIPFSSQWVTELAYQEIAAPFVEDVLCEFALGEWSGDIAKTGNLAKASASLSVRGANFERPDTDLGHSHGQRLDHVLGTKFVPASNLGLVFEFWRKFRCPYRFVGFDVPAV